MRNSFLLSALLRMLKRSLHHVNNFLGKRKDEILSESRGAEGEVLAETLFKRQEVPGPDKAFKISEGGLVQGS